MNSSRDLLKKSPKNARKKSLKNDITQTTTLRINQQLTTKQKTSLSNNDDNNNNDNNQRPKPPTQLPATISSLQKYLLGKDKELGKQIHAASKNRGKECIQFPEDTNSALPEASRSFHVVVKVRRKGELFYFKYNPLNSLMSELETGAWSCYNLIIPNRVPEKVTAHFNEKGEYFGLSVKAIKGFKSTMQESLTVEDLNDDEILTGLGECLAASDFFGEDDLHRDQVGKNGDRIDYDMSFFIVLGLFKGGSVIDWAYRPRDKERFVVTVRDLENFPDLKDAKPFYWPTKPQPIVTEETRRFLSHIVPISRNAFPVIENKLFKTLNKYPVFMYSAYKTLLKCILMSDSNYHATLSKHIRPHIVSTNEAGKREPVLKMMTDYIKSRKQQFRETLVQTPKFQQFLWKDGQKVIKEILQEFNEANIRVVKKDIKSRAKNPNRSSERLIYDSINLEEVKNLYSDIFQEASDHAVRDLDKPIRKLR